MPTDTLQIFGNFKFDKESSVRDTLQIFRNFKFHKESFVWLPWQLLKDIEFFLKNCRYISEKQLSFKYFQKPQISSSENKTLFADISILVLFSKVVLKWMRASDVWEEQVENRAKCGKVVIFPGPKKGIFQFLPKTLEHPSPHLF